MLKRRFSYHEPNTTVRAGRHEEVRETCLNAAVKIVELTGEPSREQSIAITHLENAMFWANAAIAREVNSVD